MSSDEPAYLVTQLATDVNPPTVVEEYRCPTREVAIAILTECLDFHSVEGAVTTKVQREVADARHLLDYWANGPHLHMRLCGFLHRYDVDPVPAGRLGYPGWEEMREAEQCYLREQLRLQVPGLLEGDPVYALAGAWIVAAPYPDGLFNPRAWTLGRSWEVGLTLVTGGMPLRSPTDTLASWMLAVAQRAIADGEPVEVVGATLRVADATGRPSIWASAPGSRCPVAAS